MARKELGDIAACRLSSQAIAKNFEDVAPALDGHHALLAAQRCFYCYDAPCITACPTGIDIPSFIRRIANENLVGAAKDILSANILGGSCARVCPTEILCEGACVRNGPESKPVEIGALQRHATDWVYRDNARLFERGADSGRKIAVVGAGPAGLACAHHLARAGHRVTIYDAQSKPGGLNEYGIAAYKVPEFAQREVQWLLSIGGIDVVYDKALGRDLDLGKLRADFDAVFLGIGLGGVNSLGVDGEQVEGVLNAVDFISRLRQSADLGKLPVGRRVIVIGGGNTAIDAAIQSRKLGAETVHMVYRRGEETMGATVDERAFAQTEGVHLRLWAQPRRLLFTDGVLAGMQFEHTRLDAKGKLEGSGEFFTLEADVVLKAIGQVLVPAALGQSSKDLLDVKRGRIAVDAEYRTTVPGIWAGGDCVGSRVDLTVQAVEDGKRAAQSIDLALRQSKAKVG